MRLLARWDSKTGEVTQLADSSGGKAAGVEDEEMGDVDRDDVAEDD